MILLEELRLNSEGLPELEPKLEGKPINSTRAIADQFRGQVDSEIEQISDRDSRNALDVIQEKINGVVFGAGKAGLSEDDLETARILNERITQIRRSLLESEGGTLSLIHI